MSQFKNMSEIIRLKPTLVQLSLMAYKPWVAKYHSNVSRRTVARFFREKRNDGNYSSKARSWRISEQVLSVIHYQIVL